MRICTTRWMMSIIRVGFFLFILFSLILIRISTVGAQERRILLAGASISNITPHLGNGIVGNFGDPPLAEYIHDELHARTLVLANGESSLVFVVIDNLSVAREVFDEAKRLIREETGIDPANILMSATHTHTATSSSGIGNRRAGWNYGRPFDEYQLFLIRRIADGVRNALKNLEPAKIGWGVGNVPQHVFNRRWIMHEKVLNPFGEYEQVQFNPGVKNKNKKESAGPTDPSVSFISVKAVNGKPISILANYSLHYVGGVPKNDISADYFAVFADRIQEIIGADRQSPKFVGIMSNGTSGDINNVDFRGGQQSYPSYKKIKIVADDVAQEVYRVYKDIKYHSWVPLHAIQKEVRLKTRRASEQMKKRAEETLLLHDTVKTKHALERTYARRLIQMEKEYPDEIEIILQAFRIGDLAVSALPFETFAETGLEIKKKSPFKTTFTIELANGNYGYLPTPEQHKLGGYETWFSTNKVQEDATVIIVQEFMKMFNSMK